MKGRLAVNPRKRYERTAMMTGNCEKGRLNMEYTKKAVSAIRYCPITR
jgi:hypothetical protein